MKDIYGQEYKLYKGDIWITTQELSKKVERTHIALLSEKGSLSKSIALDEECSLMFLGYIIREGDKWTFDNQKYITLYEGIWRILKSYGWYDEICKKHLGDII